MNPSPAGYQLIRKFEGCILSPYLDTAGVPSIGIGCIIYKDGTKVTLDDPPITLEEAVKLFEWQVGLKAAAVNGLHIFFNQNQFDALTSFTYNLGVTALVKSTLIRKARVNAKDPSIRAEFLRWNKTSYIKNNTKVYVPSPGLTHRREIESELYFTPV